MNELESRFWFDKNDINHVSAMLRLVNLQKKYENLAVKDVKVEIRNKVSQISPNEFIKNGLGTYQPSNVLKTSSDILIDSEAITLERNEALSMIVKGFNDVFEGFDLVLKDDLVSAEAYFKKLVLFMSHNFPVFSLFKEDSIALSDDLKLNIFHFPANKQFYFQGSPTYGPGVIRFGVSSEGHNGFSCSFDRVKNRFSLHLLEGHHSLVCSVHPLSGDLSVVKPNSADFTLKHLRPVADAFKKVEQ